MRGHRLFAGLALVFGLAVGFGFAVFPRDADAARNASGTMSLVAGNPVVTGTTISSSMFNNTMTDFKTEITDSLSRSGKGAMLAPLELVNGTVTLPALSFDSDTDTGIYRPDAGDLAISTDGVLTLHAHSGGVVMPQGAVFTQSQSGASVVIPAIYATGSSVGGVGTNVPAILAVGGSAGVGGDGIRSTGTGEGYGVRGYGGATNGVGVDGHGTGTGTGGVFVGGSSAGFGISVGPGSAATGGARTTAINVVDGDIQFGAVDPTSTTSVIDAITPLSIIKAYATVVYGSGTPSVSEGLNIASVSCAANQVTVTIAGDFAGTTFTPVVSTNQIAKAPYIVSKTAGTIVVGVYRTSTDTAQDMCSGGGSPELYLQVTGAQ